MNKSNGDLWLCPECSKREGKSNYCIKLLQMNITHAIYLCENKKCLYPGIAVKQLPLLKRTPDDIPIPTEELEVYGLPDSLKNEVGLNLSHLSKILEINSVIPYAERMVNAEKEWNAFVNRMSSLEVLKNPSLINTYCDPDLQKFKQLSSQMQMFLKHLVPEPDLYNSLLSIS